MNKITTLLFLFSVFSFSLIYSQSIEEIITIYKDRIGNEKYKQASTFIISGTIKDSTHQIEFNILFKRPNKIRFEFYNDILKSEAIIIYDGNKGWAIIPKEKYPNYLHSEITDSIKQIISDFDDRLIYHEEKEYQALLLPKATYEGKKVYIIKLMKLFGNEYKYFLDAETFQLLKIETKEKYRHEWYRKTIFPQDYKDFSGFLYPTKTITHSKGKSIITTISSIEVNKELPDSFFVLPESQVNNAQVFPLTKQIWEKIKRNR